MRFSTLVSLAAGVTSMVAAAPTAVQKRALSKFTGTNAYWLPFLTNDADVDTTLAAVKDAGLTVVRTWGFTDSTACTGIYFQCWSSGAPVINTGADGLERLDAVVASAEKNGVQLVIPFVNSWTDYGGMDVYINALGGSSRADFYTSETIKDAYKAYVKAVVSRYSSSSAILSWQLANEPRCNGCDVSVITAWATEMSAYVKSLDSTHMVSLGDEGFFNDPSAATYPYQGGEGIDWEANLAIPDLDYATAHMYTEDWGMTNEWGNTWISDHATKAAAAGKPFVLEEYGLKDESLRTEVINSWHQTVTENGVTGDMYWQFGLTLSAGATSDDKYTIFVEDSNFQELVVDWAASRV
ncbi:glycoside hydrolase superfamily [Geopyxis carbonaria]|nr:glycoside hydrolase superfamily [Geopyxis carbonaria]